MNNKEIFDKLSEKVIGHNKAKKVLINLVNRSKMRYYQKWGLLESEKLVPLSNCLLIGDSGTGKTYLVETLSEVMDFPLVKIDATELNPTGASGGLKKKDVIKKITDKAKECMESSPEIYWSYEGALDQVIVFVDEIDKLAKQIGSDWNSHVQSNFLTLFENKGELSGITYIFAGAFAGMLKKEKEIPQNSIGFFAHQEKEKKKIAEDLTQSIVQYGLIPELVGRMNTIVSLDILNEENYKNILIEQILPKAITQLNFLGIEDFELLEDQIDELVKEAMSSGLGIRALQSGLNQLLIDVEFNSEAFINYR